MSMIIDPFRFSQPIVFTSPWIAGPIGAASNRIAMRSPDGINWSTAPTVATGFTADLRRIYSDSGLMLVSGEGSTGLVPRYSLDDGETWANTSGLPTNGAVNGLCKSGSYWIASILGGSSNIYRSTDGVTWTPESTSGNLFEAIFYNSAAIVGTSSGNSRRSTDDGDTWATASVAGLSNVDCFVKTSTHVIAGTLASTTFVRRSTTGLNGSYSSSTFSGSSVSPIGYAANSSGEVLIVTTTGATFVSTNHGSTWAAGATISGESQTSYVTRNCAAYADGAWMVSTYDETVGTARIWRATSPSGPWTEVATFLSNGGPLAGVRYFAP